MDTELALVDIATPVVISCGNGYGGEACSILVQGSLFDSNQGAGAVSAISVFPCQSHMVVRECVFTNNTHVSPGAAISAVGVSSVQVFSSTFENNAAWIGYGGAIFVINIEDFTQERNIGTSCQLLLQVGFGLQ